MRPIEPIESATRAARAEFMKSCILSMLTGHVPPTKEDADTLLIMALHIAERVYPPPKKMSLEQFKEVVSPACQESQKTSS